LVLLGIAGLMLLWQMFSGGTVTPPVTTTADPRPAGQPGEQVAAADLDVRIEALSQDPAPLGEGERNPFRFQPKPSPPPPAPSPGAFKPSPPAFPANPGPPPPPPGPPAIATLIKFIGIVETGKEKIGAFSDCRSESTFSGREGETMEGRYRLVRIGVESAIVEYADGGGRTTLPLNSQACVGR
jgi:hypothetical protein